MPPAGDCFRFVQCLKGTPSSKSPERSLPPARAVPAVHQRGDPGEASFRGVRQGQGLGLGRPDHVSDTGCGRPQGREGRSLVTSTLSVPTGTALTSRGAQKTPPLGPSCLRPQAQARGLFCLIYSLRVLPPFPKYSDSQTAPGPSKRFRFGTPAAVSTSLGYLTSISNVTIKS